MRTRGRGAGGGGGGGRRKCAVARFLFAARLVTTIVILGTFSLRVMATSSEREWKCEPWGWYNGERRCGDQFHLDPGYGMTKV